MLVLLPVAGLWRICVLVLTKRPVGKDAARPPRPTCCAAANTYTAATAATAAATVFSPRRSQPNQPAVAVWSKRLRPGITSADLVPLGGGAVTAAIVVVVVVVDAEAYSAQRKGRPLEVILA